MQILSYFMSVVYVIINKQTTFTDITLRQHEN